MRVTDFIEKMERILSITLKVFELLLLAIVGVAAFAFALYDYIDNSTTLLVISILIIVSVIGLTAYVEHLKNKEAEQID